MTISAGASPRIVSASATATEPSGSARRRSSTVRISELGTRRPASCRRLRSRPGVLVEQLEGDGVEHQRVPAGHAVRRGDQAGRGLVAQTGARSFRAAGSVRGSGSIATASGRPASEASVGRLGDLAAADRHRDQHRQLGQALRQVVEPAQRLPVRPLRVVDQQGQRRARGEVVDQPGEAAEHRLPRIAEAGSAPDSSERAATQPSGRRRPPAGRPARPAAPAAGGP